MTLASGKGNEMRSRLSDADTPQGAATIWLYEDLSEQAQEILSGASENRFAKKRALHKLPRKESEPKTCQTRFA